MSKNNVQKLREEMLMSKAELARKAGVSALTIDRIESGKSCRMDTKRKIILALGFKLSDKDKVFSKEEQARRMENLAKTAGAVKKDDEGEVEGEGEEEASSDEV